METQSFIIKIGDYILKEVLEATLSRIKNSLTGELIFSLFLNEQLKIQLLNKLVIGTPVTVYINNRIAFYGQITRRSRYNNNSIDYREGLSTTDYNIRITSRGKAYHCYKTSQMTYGGSSSTTTAKQAVESLLKPFKIRLDWQAVDVPLPFFVFRDGSLVSDEIYRICNENGYFVHESRNGKIVITDSPQDVTGEDLILGKNILSFEEYIDFYHTNSHLIVKGHKNNKHDWGIRKIKEASVVLEDKTVDTYSPYIVQHYGYVDDEALKRRAKWELEQRKYLGNNLFLTVFGLRNDAYFDLGVKHFVSIPILGINQYLECIELTYNIKANNEISTQLVLAPFANKKDKIPNKGGIVDGKGDITKNPINTDIKKEDFNNIIWDRNDKGNPYFFPSDLSIPDNSLNVAVIKDYDQITTDIFKNINITTDEEEPKEYLNAVYES